jgi:hypothetical protein
MEPGASTCGRLTLRFPSRTSWFRESNGLTRRTTICWLCSIALAAVVSACGGVHNGTASGSPVSRLALRHYLGSPPGAKIVAGPDTAVSNTSGQIAVVAWGSSGCPRLAIRVDSAENNTIEVTMREYVPDASALCPADLTPTTTIIAVPAGINASRRVITKIVDGDFSATVSLPPTSGTG